MGNLSSDEVYFSTTQLILRSATHLSSIDYSLKPHTHKVTNRDTEVAPIFALIKRSRFGLWRNSRGAKAQNKHTHTVQHKWFYCRIFTTVDKCVCLYAKRNSNKDTVIALDGDKIL